MIILHDSMDRETQLIYSINTARTDIKRLRRQVRRSRGNYRDYLYVLLDEACERLNRLQRKANRMGVVAVW